MIYDYVLTSPPIAALDLLDGLNGFFFLYISRPIKYLGQLPRIVGLSQSRNR